MGCQRNVICDAGGTCKRCFQGAWPAPLDVLPRADGLEVMAIEPASTEAPASKPAYQPRCVQCGGRQSEAPGDKCKHTAWHDLPRLEVTAEPVLEPPPLEEKSA